MNIKLTRNKYSLVDDCDSHFNNWKWHFGSGGYALRKFMVSKGVQGRIYLHHAVIGRPLNGYQVDHINGDKLDNRRANLRFVSVRGNAHNKKEHRGEKPRSSKYIGVTLFKSIYKGRVLATSWRAQIREDGRRKYLGWFKKEIDAAKAYQDELKRIGFKK